MVDKAWRKELKKRLSFCVSESKMMKRLKELRRLNQDFAALRESITSLKLVDDEGLEIAPTRKSSKVNYHLVQEASSGLYEELVSKVCVQHAGHTASICLDSAVADGILRNAEADQSQRVRFGLMFGITGSGQACSGQFPVWLQIESSMALSQDRMPIVTDPTTPLKSKARSCLKRNLVRAEGKESVTMKRRVKFFFGGGEGTAVDDRTEISLTSQCSHSHSAAINAGDLLPDEEQSKGLQTHEEPTPMSNFQTNRTSNSFQQSSRVLEMPAQESSVPELTADQALCLQLENCHLDEKTVCVGVLQQRATFRHIVYRPPIQDHRRHLISLEDLLIQISKSRPHEALSPLKRVRLAISLAKMVLPFQSTPWLSNTWRSENVYFEAAYGDAGAASWVLESPRLNAKLTRKKQKLQDSSRRPKDLRDVMLQEKEHDPSQALLSPIRNRIIFDLGLMLMQIGFESTIQALRKDVDVLHGSELADFKTAMRLDEAIEKPLGMKFAKITRKCLNCDFGVGKYDLMAPELQNAFYENVIQPLEVMETKLRDLD